MNPFMHPVFDADLCSEERVRMVGGEGLEPPTLWV